MAAIREPDDSTDSSNAVIYVMPQRIQKKMLQDIKSAAKRASLCLHDKFGNDVTHIVTQYTEHEQVLRQLQRDGVSLGNSADLDGVKIVTLPWLSACLKAGNLVAVEEKHLLLIKLEPQGTQEDTTQAGQAVQGRAQNQTVPLWACQRVTPLKHFNHIFTDALETLEEHAEFRDERSDYSRALAFRRASCLLKSLPFKVERLSQVEGLKDIGGHVLNVIKSILEDGYCAEVESVSNEWFRLMKEFTSIFGVGPATAKKWIDAGWKSVDDVRNSGVTFKDSRVIWGLAFHEDLTTSVSVGEAHAFLAVVKTEAEKILPGVVATMTGGFRRGKSHGHDVDILLTHPAEGQEQGMLSALLQVLERKGLVLTGRLEASTYTPDCLASDSKLVSMRGQFDHFEKWLGICKFFSESPDLPATTTSSIHSESVTRTTTTAEGEGEGEEEQLTSASTKTSERDTTNFRTNDSTSETKADTRGSDESTSRSPPPTSLPASSRGSRPKDTNATKNEGAEKAGPSTGEEEEEGDSRSARGRRSAKGSPGRAKLLNARIATTGEGMTSSKHQTEHSERESSDKPKLETVRSVTGESEAHKGSDEDKPKLKHKASEGGEPPRLKRQKTSGQPSSLSELRQELATSVGRTWRARRVDLVVVPYLQYFYALVGWTGNKQFNRDLRTYAQRELGMKLTSHGLWDFTKQRAVPASSEAEVFSNLKLEYREPAHRNC